MQAHLGPTFLVRIVLVRLRVAFNIFTTCDTYRRPFHYLIWASNSPVCKIPSLPIRTSRLWSFLVFNLVLLRMQSINLSVIVNSASRPWSQRCYSLLRVGEFEDMFVLPCADLLIVRISPLMISQKVARNYLSIRMIPQEVSWCGIKVNSFSKLIKHLVLRIGWLFGRYFGKLGGQPPIQGLRLLLEWKSVVDLDFVND